MWRSCTKLRVGPADSSTDPWSHYRTVPLSLEDSVEPSPLAVFNSWGNGLVFPTITLKGIRFLDKVAGPGRGTRAEKEGAEVEGGNTESSLVLLETPSVDGVRHAAVGYSFTLVEELARFPHSAVPGTEVTIVSVRDKAQGFKRLARGELDRSANIHLPFRITTEQFSAAQGNRWGSDGWLPQLSLESLESHWASVGSDSQPVFDSELIPLAVAGVGSLTDKSRRGEELGRKPGLLVRAEALLEGADFVVLVSSASVGHSRLALSSLASAGVLRSCFGVVMHQSPPFHSVSTSPRGADMQWGDALVARLARSALEDPGATANEKQGHLLEDKRWRINLHETVLVQPPYLHGALRALLAGAVRRNQFRVESDGDSCQLIFPFCRPPLDGSMSFRHQLSAVAPTESRSQLAMVERKGALLWYFLHGSPQPFLEWMTRPGWRRRGERSLIPAHTRRLDWIASLVVALLFPVALVDDGSTPSDRDYCLALISHFLQDPEKLAALLEGPHNDAQMKVTALRAAVRLGLRHWQADQRGAPTPPPTTKRPLRTPTPGLMRYPGSTLSSPLLGDPLQVSIFVRERRLREAHREFLEVKKGRPASTQWKRHVQAASGGGNQTKGGAGGRATPRAQLEVQFSHCLNCRLRLDPASGSAHTCPFGLWVALLPWISATIDTSAVLPETLDRFTDGGRTEMAEDSSELHLNLRGDWGYDESEHPNYNRVHQGTGIAPSMSAVLRATPGMNDELAHVLRTRESKRGRTVGEVFVEVLAAIEKALPEAFQQISQSQVSSSKPAGRRSTVPRSLASCKSLGDLKWAAEIGLVEEVAEFDKEFRRVLELAVQEDEGLVFHAAALTNELQLQLQRYSVEMNGILSKRLSHRLNRQGPGKATDVSRAAHPETSSVPLRRPPPKQADPVKVQLEPTPSTLPDSVPGAVDAKTSQPASRQTNDDDLSTTIASGSTNGVCPACGMTTDNLFLHLQSCKGF